MRAAWSSFASNDPATVSYTESSGRGSPGGGIERVRSFRTTFSHVAASAFTSVPTGTYELRVTAANTKYLIFDTGAQAFGEQTLSNIIAITKGSARLVDVAVLNIDSNGTGQVKQNLLGQGLIPRLTKSVAFSNRWP